MTDVTDASFEEEVLALSETVPVVVDLWAPWCGPCRTLGPIIEEAVAETEGAVALAKVNIDENPQVAAAFQVQSIPAVYALRDRKVVDGFIGALPASQVRAFVERIAPALSEADELVAAGDEESLRRALELQPDHVGAIVALAELLVRRGGDLDAALALLQRVPETAETRRVAALARLAAAGLDDALTAPGGGDDSVGAHLDELLERVKHDEQARQEFLDLLETMDPDDPERSRYRRALASQLF
jgi:putative thioredoxin